MVDTDAAKSPPPPRFHTLYCGETESCCHAVICLVTLARHAQLCSASQAWWLQVGQHWRTPLARIATVPLHLSLSPPAWGFMFFPSNLSPPLSSVGFAMYHCGGGLTGLRSIAMCVPYHRQPFIKQFISLYLQHCLCFIHLSWAVICVTEAARGA